MLATLRRIVQEVNSAPDLTQGLATIVRRVKKAMGTDVCSVYLVDPETQFNVLMATDGLTREAVGQVRLKLSEGLVGSVATRAEPINLDSAPTHPNYLFVPETDEQPYHGFLGVPIIQHRKVLGVLVVQKVEQWRFDEDEVTFLVTLATQLASAIIHAGVSGDIGQLPDRVAPANYFLDGQAGAPGVVFGQAVAIYSPAKLAAIPDRRTLDPAQDEALFRAAVAAVREEITRFGALVDDALPAEDRALFEAYLMMLNSEALMTRTIERIHGGNWALGALRETIEDHARVFDEMEDAYLSERASDIRDLGRRILVHLQANERSNRDYPADTILIGEEIVASQLAEVPVHKLKGVVSARGSGSSHAAILARALGIPAVLGVTDLPVAKVEGREVIVDGYNGRVHIAPSGSVRKEYVRIAQEESELSQDLEGLRHLPAQTPDGIRIPLYMNAGLLADVSSATQSGADGVGLYRTEFPFMSRDRFPGEEAQRDIYRQVLQAFAPRPVTMRTLDVGGDKPLSYFPITEENPFLGWRGIRITLDHPEIFLTQLRAMIGAAAGLGNLQLLLPMISGTGELEEALGMVRQAHRELVDEGLTVAMPPVGVMVEVPAAVFQAGALARRVDFLSIGTNDLTQYLLAVDRNNASVAELYDSLHPAVLQAIVHTVKGARTHGRTVSVCGEMAADPAAVILLLGMGIDELSTSVGSLPRVKWVIRSFSKEQARRLLDQALAMEDAQSVRELLFSALQASGLGGLIRAGKQ